MRVARIGRRGKQSAGHFSHIAYIIKTRSVSSLHRAKIHSPGPCSASDLYCKSPLCGSGRCSVDVCGKSDLPIFATCRFVKLTFIKPCAVHDCRRLRHVGPVHIYAIPLPGPTCRSESSQSEGQTQCALCCLYAGIRSQLCQQKIGRTYQCKKHGGSATSCRRSSSSTRSRSCK